MQIGATVDDLVSEFNIH